MSVASSTRSLSFAVSIGARRGIGRRATDFRDERRQRAAQVLDRVLDRLGARGRPAPRGASPRRFASSGAISRCRSGRCCSSASTKNPSPESDSARSSRSSSSTGGVRVRVAVDLLLAQAEQALGVVLLQHPQRAANLVAVLAERRDLGALRVVAEERVEHLLHAPQVGLDLARDLREQDALLRAAEDPVDQRPGGRGDRTRRLRRVEPRQHRRDLLREIAREAAEVLDGALGEQDARRVLHREHIRHVARRRHRVEPRDERRRQFGQRRVADRDGVRRAPIAASRCSFGRLSARPSVTCSQMFFAVPSCSRTSRRIGWSRTGPR